MRCAHHHHRRRSLCCRRRSRRRPRVFLYFFDSRLPAAIFLWPFCSSILMLCVRYVRVRSFSGRPLLAAPCLLSLSFSCRCHSLHLFCFFLLLRLLILGALRFATKKNIYIENLLYLRIEYIIYEYTGATDAQTLTRELNNRNRRSFQFECHCCCCRGRNNEERDHLRLAFLCHT